MTRGLKHALQIGLPAVLLSIAPLTFTMEAGVTEQQACAQSGTCCREADSLCIVGGNFARDYYFKKEGPCQKQT